MLKEWSYASFMAWKKRSPGGALQCLLRLTKRTQGILRTGSSATFIYQCYDDHGDLHRVDRRQRQMCIRDRGKAVHYALGQWAKLSVFLTHAEVPLDNNLSLIHISEPTRLGMISYAVFCL